MKNILDEYVRSYPSPQNAVDLFTGEWSSRFPSGVGIEAGHIPLFEDTRVSWVIERAGGVSGKNVLELGPLEGGHTAMLHSAGASVVAIESNSRAFLKCLITKEVMGLANAQFLLGDFVKYLEVCQVKYDLVLASGVLYHASDPLHLLKLLAAQNCPLGIWTHYFDESVLTSKPHLLRFFGERSEAKLFGRSIGLYRRNYLESLDWNGFCGGPENSAVWIDRKGLLEVLTLLGFNQVEILEDNPEHPNGPSIMLFVQNSKQ